RNREARPRARQLQRQAASLAFVGTSYISGKISAFDARQERHWFWLSMSATTFHVLLGSRFHTQTYFPLMLVTLPFASVIDISKSPCSHPISAAVDTSTPVVANFSSVPGCASMSAQPLRIFSLPTTAGAR